MNATYHASLNSVPALSIMPSLNPPERLYHAVQIVCQTSLQALNSFRVKLL